MLRLMQDELCIGGNEVEDKTRSVIRVAIEARAPGVYEDLVDFVRICGQGAWFSVVIFGSSGVGDLAGMSGFNGFVCLPGEFVVVKGICLFLFVVFGGVNIVVVKSFVVAAELSLYLEVSGVSVQLSLCERLSHSGFVDVVSVSGFGVGQYSSIMYGNVLSALFGALIAVARIPMGGA